MKYKYKEYTTPKNGTRRIVNKFAWLPVCIEGEGRWLERVKVEQVFWRDYVNYEEPDFACWKNLSFIGN